jgi:hypothetical protein
MGEDDGVYSLVRHEVYLCSSPGAWSSTGGREQGGLATIENPILMDLHRQASKHWHCLLRHFGILWVNLQANTVSSALDTRVETGYCARRTHILGGRMAVG